ncbi:MAG: flippase-like domain-containing protein [Anaerolineae bacterium]|nr:flippase-like domain-containing protein [Anaerolineae bacterium]
MRKAARNFIAAPRTRFVLGIALGGFFFYLAVRGVDWAEIGEGLRHADARFVAAAFMLILFNILIKIVRWKKLLFSAAQPLKSAEVSASFLWAQLLNSLFPLRVGEVSRVVVMGGRGADHGFVIGTILIEKYLDTLAFGVLLSVVGLTLPMPDWLASPARSFIVLVGLSALAILFLSRNQARVQHWAKRISRGFGERAADFTLKNLHSAYSALHAVKQTPNLLYVTALTLLIWLTALATNQALFLALNLELPVKAALVVLATITVGLSLPALPGKVGVFEYACILALGLFEVDQSRALSYGILLHMVVYFPIVVLGILSVQYLQMRTPSPVRQKTNQAE